MGNNHNRHTQWSEDPKKPTGPLCGALQPKWPYRSCTRRPGHDGNHCNRTQAGNAMIVVWWERQEETTLQSN